MWISFVNMFEWIKHCYSVKILSYMFPLTLKLILTGELSAETSGVASWKLHSGDLPQALVHQEDNLSIWWEGEAPYVCLWNLLQRNACQWSRTDYGEVSGGNGQNAVHFIHDYESVNPAVLVLATKL